MTRHEPIRHGDRYRLEDRYDRASGRVFMTGTQALVRVLLDQASREDHVHLSHTLNAQLDFRPRPSTMLGLSTIVSLRSNEIENRTDVSQGPSNAALERFSHLAIQESAPRRFDTRVMLHHSFEEDHILDAQLRVQRSTQDREASYRYEHLSPDVHPTFVRGITHAATARCWPTISPAISGRS
jgi:hypothetical protein